MNTGTVQTKSVTADISELRTIGCPRCQHPLAQTNMRAGSVHRHRCKRCGEWTVVIVVDAPARPADVLTAAPA